MYHSPQNQHNLPVAPAATGPDRPREFCEICANVDCAPGPVPATTEEELADYYGPEEYADLLDSARTSKSFLLGRP